MYKNDFELYPEYELAPQYETLFEQENESFFSWLTDIPATAIDYLKRGSEFIAIKAAITGGQKDENKLTNMVFFNRHPELGGKPLVKSMPNFNSLSNEWLTIRDTQVRPALSPPVPTPSTPYNPTPSIPGSSANMPPLDGPYKGITGYIGKSGKKCWKGAKSASIIDSDAPWNKPGNRSAANYIAVLDYLNVGEDDSKGTGNSILKLGENPRYQQQRDSNGNVSTYCNIYVSDATRAMWAMIPHWVRNPKQTKPPVGWNELNANATVKWLLANGRAAGWMQINASMIKWIGDLFTQKRAVPVPDNAYTSNLAQAALKLISATGITPAMLTQPSYIAQLFANLGLPTTCVWNNPGGIGHVAMVRPEENMKKGKVVSGVFIPRSAQAGSKNYSSNYLVFGASALKGGSVLFFVHE
jgi:hypothetical protein